MGKGIGIFGWILSVLILLAIITPATITFFDFNIFVWLSFGVKWVEYVLVVIVGVLGVAGLINLITKTFKKIV